MCVVMMMNMIGKMWERVASAAAAATEERLLDLLDSQHGSPVEDVDVTNAPVVRSTVAIRNKRRLDSVLGNVKGAHGDGQTEGKLARGSGVRGVVSTTMHPDVLPPSANKTICETPSFEETAGTDEEGSSKDEEGGPSRWRASWTCAVDGSL